MKVTVQGGYVPNALVELAAGGRLSPARGKAVEVNLFEEQEKISPQHVSDSCFL